MSERRMHRRRRARRVLQAKKTGSPDLRQLRKSPEAIPFTKLVKGKVVPAEQVTS